MFDSADFHAAAVARLAVTAGFARRPVSSRWQSSAWRLEWVRPAGSQPAASAAGGPGGDGPGGDHEAAGCGALERTASDTVMAIHRDEAEGYWLNVTATEPSIFVLWRAEDGSAPHALAATLSYNEASRWMDGGESVDRVAMPAEMLAWLTDWVNRTYEPQRRKRQRGPKPSFMTRDEHERFARGDASDVGGPDAGRPARSAGGS